MFFQFSVKECFMEKVNYIHQNPVRGGLVDRATDYRWSSTWIWLGGPLEDEPLLVDKDPVGKREATLINGAKPEPGA